MKVQKVLRKKNLNKSVIDYTFFPESTRFETREFHDLMPMYDYRFNMILLKK